MIRWESGPDTVADQVDPSWQQPSLMAESPQRDKAPCNTTKTGRSPQGVDLASNFPRTQDKKISARRAGRSPIQGGSTSQATGLKGSGTRDRRTPPVSCFHALMIRVQPDPCYDLESSDSFQNIQLLLSCVGIWGTWRPFWRIERFPCSFLTLLSSFCSVVVLLQSTSDGRGLYLPAWLYSVVLTHRPSAAGICIANTSRLPAWRWVFNALVLSSGQRSGCKHSSSPPQYQWTLHWFRRKHVSVPVNSS